MTKKKLTNKEKTHKALNLIGDFGKVTRQSVREENIEFLNSVKFGLYGLSSEINELQKQIDFWIDRQSKSDHITLEELEDRYKEDD